MAAVLAGANTAYAQRADENATTSAEDAFGTKVGNEGVGLYDQNSARGFSPQLAGNLRVEGLYIDIQGIFGVRLQKSQSMHIGLAAQSYPFPAPTGIADVAMVMPTDRTIVSVQKSFAPTFGMSPLTIDITTPLIGDKLGFAGGYNTMMVRGDGRTSGRIQTFAGDFRWHPTENFEVIPFFYANNTFNAEAVPQVLLAGAALPPEFDRHTFYGQKWASRRSDEQNYGVIARGTLFGNWRLQSGLFHTQQTKFKGDVVFFRNVRSDGTGTLDVLRYPKLFSESYSGEVRATGVYTTGNYRSTIHIGARGRDVTRRFGGGNDIAFGAATVGVYQPVAEPTFRFATLDLDKVKQYTPGVTYVGQWAGMGEFSVGVQKSFFHRDFGKENAVPATVKSHPWLYNGTLSATPTKDLILYASYTRGIEDFGTAPDNAANGGEPLAARVTKQIDGGLRYRIMPGLNFLAGVFEISKPFFDRNTANVYTTVGSLRHRGAEFSLTGKPIPNVTLVAGAMLLQARVSGLPVDQGLIGTHPPGTFPSLYRLSVQYDVPQLKGFSVDSQFESNGGYYANRVNTLKVGSANTVTMGTRYQFKIHGISASVRAQVFNVFNAYDWVVDNASGRITPTQPRRFTARLAADF